MARLSDEVRAAVAADLRKTIGTEDGSIRKIGARHGVSMTFVRKVASEHGLDFTPETRARIQNAAQTHGLTNAQRRERLAKRMIEKAEELLESLDGEVYTYAFGGKDGMFSDAVARRPSPADAKHILTAAGIAVDKHKVLETFDSAAAGGQQAELLMRLLTGQQGS